MQNFPTEQGAWLNNKLRYKQVGWRPVLFLYPCTSWALKSNGPHSPTHHSAGKTKANQPEALLAAREWEAGPVASGTLDAMHSCSHSVLSIQLTWTSNRTKHNQCKCLMGIYKKCREKPPSAAERGGGGGAAQAGEVWAITPFAQHTENPREGAHPFNLQSEKWGGTTQQFSLAL